MNKKIEKPIKDIEYFKEMEKAFRNSGADAEIFALVLAKKEDFGQVFACRTNNTSCKTMTELKDFIISSSKDAADVFDHVYDEDLKEIDKSKKSN